LPLALVLQPILELVALQTLSLTRLIAAFGLLGTMIAVGERPFRADSLKNSKIAGLRKSRKCRILNHCKAL